MGKFVKGVSGNPNGRPPGASSYKTKIQGAFIEALDKKGPGKAGKANFQKFLETFMDDAVAHPDGRAAAFVAERLFSGDILNQIDATLHRDRREDIDFLCYRIRKSCHKYQQMLIDSNEKVSMLMAGRQSGKTQADVRKAALVAVEAPNRAILFLGLTFTKAVDLFWLPLERLLVELGVTITRSSRSDGEMVLDNGSSFFFKGNSTAVERDRLRGPHYDLVIIDEAQSQSHLADLITEIIEPMLATTGGSLILSGSGPKVRGTWWETMWSDEEKTKGLRLNWNIRDNPFAKNPESILANVLKDHSWTENNPVYQTEWKGKIAYDDDALVYRMTDDNYFTQEQLTTWVKSQPPSDIKFVAGIDYGFEDYTAIALLCYSTHKREAFLIYEKKFNRSGVDDVKLALDECVMAVNDKPFENVPLNNKKFLGYADTAGGMKMVSYQLTMQFGFNILPAIKDNKSLAIEQLQNEVKQRILKVRKDDSFDQEALRIIFGRDEQGNLTREISDEYHPDLMDGLLYAFRHIWTSYPKRLERPEEALSQFEREEREFFGSNNKLLTI